MTVKRISEISPDLHIQELLGRLDQNHDQQIDTDEVDFDQDGFLDLTSTSHAWSIDERNEIQNSLFRQSLIRFRTIERLEVDGDPNVGSVVFIRQIHDRPEINNELRIPIGNYQFGIMLYLMSHNATHLFMEGLTEDIPNNPQVEAVNIGPLANATFHHTLTNQFYIDLTRLMAGDFYAAFYPHDVYQHRTAEPEEEEVVFSIIDSPLSSGTQAEHYTMAVRESLATTQIMRFLRDHPEETAYLIYGSAHEFTDNFASYPYPPRVISVSFPDHAKPCDEIIANQERENRQYSLSLLLFASLFTFQKACRATSHFLSFLSLQKIERFYSGRSSNIFDDHDDDDQNPPTAPRGTGATNTTNSSDENPPGVARSSLEALEISAGLATLGTAAIQYGPQVVNAVRTAAPIAVRILALGLMMMGG